MGESAPPLRDAPYGAYGRHLAKCFDLNEAPSHVARTLRRGITAVSHLELTSPKPDLTSSVKCDDAYLLVVHLRDLVNHELWFDDRLVSRAPQKAGAAHLYDLGGDPRARVFQPASTVHFYLPKSSLNEFAEQHGLAPIADLASAPGAGVEDSVMSHLSLAALHALHEPHATTGLLLDQIMNGVCAHTLSRFGRMSAATSRGVGGLAAWQERRAKELMDAELDVSLTQIAASCQLSVTHFVRAFRQSTGMSPHQWLIRRRVQKAMALLVDPTLDIAEIALSCGFSSQSHLNRAFSARVGMPPGQWRRLRQLPRD